ncbi:porin [Dickeya solani]|uniref:Outer membrane protein F n=1 Tax=Dickeya solani D s0432-1 TaxID=1231725 RepID=A0AAV3K6C1_9GAMM|nr:porin [Dickeya solani]ANE73994.1 porin [Dickeya solani IPO 2222]AUC41134.1 Outer membrane protein F precursor [Dickeya solani RNS 08.23.3.1.A]AUH10589.1 porin [Dickeya solani D s0432-1]AUH14523.1 porin [Dickeya solani]AYQ48418.1 Outer membrane protein F precursor [Dickeya solani]
MMKRNVLAVVIPALLAAGAANAAEVYNKDGNKLDLTGKIEAAHYFGDESKSAFGDGDQTYTRLGFKGETQISKDLTGYGRFEYQFDASNAEDSNSLPSSNTGSKTRYAYAGLKFGDFGSLDYGRNRAIGYDGISYTDVLPEQGGDSSYTDNLTGRNAGVATYRNKNFFGLVDGWDFALGYQAKHNDSTQLRKQTGDGWAISSSYTAPFGVGVIGSYTAADRTDSQNVDGRGEKAEAWATGLKYDANNVYVAATYGEYHNLTYKNSAASFAYDKTKVFEAVAQYTFDFGLTPSLGYVTAKADDDTSAAKTSGYLKKYVSVGATYAFNKNFSTLVEYDINLIDNDNNPHSVATGNTVAVGAIYQF